MIGVYAGFVGIKLDGVHVAFVAYHEKAFVKVTFEELGFAQKTGLEYLMFLELRFGCHYIITGVELVLKPYRCGIGHVKIVVYSCHGRVERVDSIIKRIYSGIGHGQLAAQILDFACLGVYLVIEHFDCAFELIGVERRFLEPGLELRQLFATLL